MRTAFRERGTPQLSAAEKIGVMPDIRKSTNALRL
jgi:hypothetical protein